jgi:4-hydroxy-3-methylbut-2-enyl diphosphate reductase IspH
MSSIGVVDGTLRGLTTFTGEPQERIGVAAFNIIRPVALESLSVESQSFRTVVGVPNSSNTIEELSFASRRRSEHSILVRTVPGRLGFLKS